MELVKLTKSYKKQEFPNQTSRDVGFRSLEFAHKASGGETSLDLTALVVPTELSSYGFTNPSVSQIQDAKLLFFSANMILWRSQGGAMINNSEFQVITNTKINLTKPAAVNEVFYGKVMAVPVPNQGVDARVIYTTGTLLAGQTDINVGQEFRVNKNPLAQIGEVEFVLEGETQMRNVNNAIASPSADGNYQEVDSGNGYSALLRVNQSVSYDRSYIVRSTVIYLWRSSGSRDAVIESLSGQVDRLVQVLASVSGQPTSYFQSGPNSVQMLQYGNIVASLVPSIATKSANFAPVSSQKWETYEVNAASGDITVTLPSPSSANSGNMLTFKKVDATYNFVTLSGTLDETVVLQNQNELTCVQSDGSTWIKIQ